MFLQLRPLFMNSRYGACFIAISVVPRIWNISHGFGKFLTVTSIEQKSGIWDLPGLNFAMMYPHFRGFLRLRQT
jgi:hypothetical protein